MSVTNQARKIETVAVATSNVIVGSTGLSPADARLKAIRCDQAGVLTASLNDGEVQTLNLLQGEVLNWTGTADLSTDATCRLTVELL
jgi:hypothetical protein